MKNKKVSISGKGIVIEVQAVITVIRAVQLFRILIAEGQHPDEAVRIAGAICGIESWVLATAIADLDTVSGWQVLNSDLLAHQRREPMLRDE